MAVQLVNYDNLETWLSQQPNNTVDTPYELQILTPSSGSDIRSILQDNPNKYVDLRYTLLSNSTDFCDFRNCLTLVGAPKCQSSSSKPQFEGCTNLKYVNYVSYDNLDDIFKGCTSLIDAGTIYNSRWNGTRDVYGTSMQSTFEGCVNLKSVIIEDSHNALQNISYAFKNCTSLEESPELPNGITDMTCTFYGCVNLEEAPTIPDSVTSLDSTFYGCENLVNAPVIPDSVTSLAGTFRQCYSLVNAPVIPDSVIYMNSTFYGCSHLEKAPVIPNSVTRMNACFRECTSLAYKPIIPSSVTSANYCYTSVTQTNWGGSSAQIDEFMSTVNSECEVYEIVPDTDNNCYEPTGRTVYCVDISNLNTWLSEHPVNTKSTAYEICIISLTSANLTNIKTALTGNATKFVDLQMTQFPSGITTLANCFQNCKSLIKSPAIPSTVTNMNYTFDKCSNLIEFPEIPSGVTTLEFTFRETEITESPTLPNGLLYMYGTFKNCRLLSVTPIIPNTVRDYSQTFSGCTSLTTPPTTPSSAVGMNYTFENTAITTAPTIPNSVTSMIGTFKGTMITSAPTLPSSLEYLKETFRGCSKLATATAIPNGVLEMDYAFEGCTSLEVTPSIPDTAWYLAKSFSGCTNLKTITNFPNERNNGINLVQAFENCRSLINVPDFPATARILFIDWCFSNCTSLRHIISIPFATGQSGYEGGGQGAFAGCSSLEVIDNIRIPLNYLKNNEKYRSMFLGCTSLKTIGYKIEESNKWHIFRLKFGQNTVEGKVYDESGNATDINGGTAVSITKDTLTLPVKTDEIWFPNTEQDSEIDDIIEDVIENHYTYYKKTVIPPDDESFVLLAKDPNKVITNIGGGGGTDITVYDTLAQAEADLPNLSVGDIIGTKQGGDGAVDAVISGDMRLVTSNAVATELVDGSAWTKIQNLSSLTYKKLGKTVFLRLNATNSELKFTSHGGSLTINSSSTAISLPSAIRPINDVNVALCDNTYDNIYHGRIKTNGSIVAWDNAVRSVTTVNSWQLDICYRLD